MPSGAARGETQDALAVLLPRVGWQVPGMGNLGTMGLRRLTVRPATVLQLTEAAAGRCEQPGAAESGLYGHSDGAYTKAKPHRLHCSSHPQCVTVVHTMVPAVIRYPRTSLGTYVRDLALEVAELRSAYEKLETDPLRGRGATAHARSAAGCVPYRVGPTLPYSCVRGASCGKYTSRDTDATPCLLYACTIAETCSPALPILLRADNAPSAACGRCPLPPSRLA